MPNQHHDLIAIFVQGHLTSMTYYMHDVKTLLLRDQPFEKDKFWDDVHWLVLLAICFWGLFNNYIGKLGNGDLLKNKRWRVYTYRRLISLRY